MRAQINFTQHLTLALLVGMALTGPGVAQTTGTIRGTVKDPSGAVIPNVSVVVRNTGTGSARSVISDDQGAYAFPLLPVGHYELEINFQGFKPYRRTGLAIAVNSTLQVDATLELGGQGEVLTVKEDAVHVETADTQLGQAITSQQVVEVPLNGRSYTDLLAIQAGVTPVNTSANPNVSSGGAFGSITVSGNLNPGQFSINGQRESANGFSLNGANVQEGIASAAAIIPNLDSIAEFRILTSNFDAEYGNYSGGLVNVITKSGGQEFHGSLFEFLRNTSLDARGFFDLQRAKFNQSQFGGTFGGPIKGDKIFFFTDYQGGRTVQGIGTGLIPVPSLQNRSGDLSDQANALTGTVKSPFMANLLTQRLGYTVFPNEPFYAPGCTQGECVFPNAFIPRSAWSVPAQRLLQYIPAPNYGTNTFSSAAFAKRVRDDKGSGRVDANTRFGALSAYYFIDHYNLNDPYPTTLGGANVPGFNARSNGRAQLLSLSDTKTFGATAVNELRLSYLRNTHRLGQQTGGVGVSLAEQGIVAGDTGVVLGAPQVAGVTSVQFNKLTFGTNPFAILQINNTYQVADNFSKVIGNHTLKFGGQGKQERVKQDVDLIANGQFQFFGTTTGSDFADFLIGTVSVYQQQFTPVFHEQSKYFGLYLQDSWRARSNLTLNYGLRWDYIQPWSERDLQTSTLIPGVPSQKFPGAPLGYVLPGDVDLNGSVIPSTIAPTRKNNFSPRIGLAYSPSWEKGFLAKLTGGPGKSSVRAGFGRFFTAIEGLTVAYPTGNPPYGLTYISPEPPLFETPFIGAQTGRQYPQQFPVDVPPYNITRQNPDRRDFSRYTPINGAVSYHYQNKTPYSENYFLSFQRQFGTNTVFTASYIGSQGHHLMVLLAANPGDPALCLSVSQPSQVMPGTLTCGPLGENGVYTRRDGTVINGTRRPFSNDIGSNGYFYNNGNSVYHSMQVSLNHTSKRLTLLGSYTYGKSIDMASNLGEQVYPYDYKLRRAISSFDLKHNFVVSYRYELPFDQLFHRKNKLTEGWALSGITRLSTGIPVTLFNFNDTSLIGSQNQGVNGVGSDLPDYGPGPLQINHNPRNGKPYFNTGLFSIPALGTPGTASRRPFYGPGINNFDIALLKETRLTESRVLELRFETFNTFNHAQFYGASSVDSNIDSRTFGRVVSAAPPRIAQVAIRLRF